MIVYRSISVSRLSFEGRAMSVINIVKECIWFKDEAFFYGHIRAIFLISEFVYEQD